MLRFPLNLRPHVFWILQRRAAWRVRPPTATVRGRATVRARSGRGQIRNRGRWRTRRAILWMPPSIRALHADVRGLMHWAVISATAKVISHACAWDSAISLRFWTITVPSAAAATMWTSLAGSAANQEAPRRAVHGRDGHLAHRLFNSCWVSCPINNLPKTWRGSTPRRCKSHEVCARSAVDRGSLRRLSVGVSPAKLWAGLWLSVAA